MSAAAAKKPKKPNGNPVPELLPRPAEPVRAPGELVKPACTLTAYQLAVLKWVADGKTNEEIAGIMSTTSGSVRGHLYRICEVTGAASRGGAAAMALRNGWIK